MTVQDHKKHKEIVRLNWEEAGELITYLIYNATVSALSTRLIGGEGGDASDMDFRRPAGSGQDRQD